MEEKNGENREKVGKGNPPKHTRFPPGNNANPNGKKKGTLNSATVIRQFLAATTKAKNPVTGKMELMTQMQQIVAAQLKKAKKGENTGFNNLLDRTEGKPKQINEITAGGDADFLFFLMQTSAPQQQVIPINGTEQHELPPNNPPQEPEKE